MGRQPHALKGTRALYASPQPHVVVVSNGSSTLDLLVNAALAVAVIWVLPRMTVEREAEARNARVTAERATDQT